MERPALEKDISQTDFKDFYWLKAELADFCKRVGINTSGNKIELTKKIQQYLLSGEVVSNPTTRNKATSRFDWNNEQLSNSTVITDNYKNTEKIRAYFISQIAPHFSFRVQFMNWMKDNTGKNLAEAVEQWKLLKEQTKDKNYQTEIGPQFEYNRYMRAFLSDNPHLSGKDARRCWKLKRAMRGTNAYERTDLDLE